MITNAKLKPMLGMGEYKRMALRFRRSFRLAPGLRPLAVFLICLAFSARAETFDAAVVRIVDGDSLILLVKQQQVRVRLKEIDAPELKQPFGKRSQQSLADMCAAKRARVIWTEKDRNGRLLARVWCSRVDANAEQVRRGMAWVFHRYVEDPEPVPAARRRAIRTARFMGRCRAGSALEMASSEKAAGIPGPEVTDLLFARLHH